MSWSLQAHATLSEQEAVPTWVRLADFIDEVRVEACDDSATHGHHEVLVTALHEGVHSADTGRLVGSNGTFSISTSLSFYRYNPIYFTLKSLVF